MSADQQVLRGAGGELLLDPAPLVGSRTTGAVRECVEVVRVHFGRLATSSTCIERTEENKNYKTKLKLELHVNT